MMKNVHVMKDMKHFKLSVHADMKIFVLHLPQKMLIISVNLNMLFPP